jgi:DNA polymerase III subunit gamma/tau
MAYETLPLKYRPKTLDDMHGQRHIARSLSNSVKNKQIAHAYLFTGWHGTGKTSTARIVAMMLNCEDGVTDKPCCKCSSCLSIINGNAMDIQEIDAASNRGIDDIRRIQGNARLSPVHLRCKVCILDEAHMLTAQASNALLKLIEEPPSHMYFILCTTEPKAILPTIHSRCEQYNFRKIVPKDIIARLSEITANENIAIDDESMHVIAKYSNGSLRNAIANLDQIWKFCGENKISADETRSALGAVYEGACHDLVEAIRTKSVDKGICIVNEMLNSGIKPELVYQEMTSHVRNLALVATCKDPTYLGLSKHEIEKLSEQSRQLSISVAIKIFNIFAAGQEGIALNINHQHILEMNLLQSIAIVAKSERTP